ncbi:TetR/AcrR family transcriptional regulator [Piscinibacter sp.]|jgi:AcrR family transcriptional regulator|uniref:TetR/AcrR family transcriptional regulator n=1 Tax=Piscinibacter sp. TaxID=1903157 RepID=UPI00355A27C3
MSVPAVTPRQRRKEARPQELLDAALELFVEKGFAATRQDEIAARAGVSKGTLYLYYPSKEELLKAVIRERLSTEIEAGMQQVRQHVGSNADLLRSLLPRWWENMFNSPASGVFKLIITEVRTFPEIADYYMREVVEPGHHLIGTVLQRGIEAGEFRPINVEGAVHSLVLPMVMLCLHKHSLGACSAIESLGHPHDFIQQHIDLVLRGLEIRDTKPGAAAPRKPRPG